MPAIPRASSPTDPTATTALASTTATRGVRRLGAAALVVAVAAGSGFAVHSVRTADTAAATERARSARSDLALEVETLRAALSEPARAGQTAATALLRQQVDELAGEPADADLHANLVTQLRDAADDLEAAAATPAPELPGALPVSAADALFARLSGLEAQAVRVAEHLRASADHAEPWSASVAQLTAAATEYGEVRLSSTSDPDTVAATWRSELDRLETYRDAIEDADVDDVRPSLRPLADAQLAVIEAMAGTAEEAVALLGDDDLDGYNQLLDERLGDDQLEVEAGIADARERIASEAVTSGHLEMTRSRALGLLVELDELRRAAPAHLADRTQA